MMVAMVTYECLLISWILNLFFESFLSMPIIVTRIP